MGDRFLASLTDELYLAEAGLDKPFESPQALGQSWQAQLNRIGALAWGREKHTLHFELSRRVSRAVRLLLLSMPSLVQLEIVVVLDNARFHTSSKVKEKRSLWEDQGVFLRYLPPYAPHLNSIEALWKHLKGFLLPRCCYDSVAQLKRALLEALDLLGAIRVNSSVGEA